METKQKGNLSRNPLSTALKRLVEEKPETIG